MLTVLLDFGRRHRYIFFFSCAWILGLFAGAYIAINTTTIHNSLTQMLYHSHLSVIGFLAMLTFPFLLSAILFRMSFWGAVIPLMFLKAFSYSLCASYIIYCLDNSGWLLRWFFMFSETIISVLFIWYVVRFEQRKGESRQNDLLLCLIITLTIGCIDSHMISPFGVSILSYF